MTSTPEAPDHLERLVGSWTTEATHPAFPGVVVHGTMTAAWLPGGRFLEQRSENDHPDFPDSLCVIGVMGHDRVDPAARSGVPADDGSQLAMHYYDSRGVFRVWETAIDEASWRWVRIAPGFSQRFTGTFSDDGAVITGICQLRQDADWADDLEITYRRA